MSTNHHTPIEDGQPANETTFSTPLGELDQAITDLATRGCARYSTDAGQVIQNATTTIIDFEDKSYDTANEVAVGTTWKYTAVKAGVRLVSVHILFALAATWAAAEVVTLQLFKNGVLYSTLSRPTVESATAMFLGAGGSDSILLAAGDFIDIRVGQGSGGPLALNNNSTHNYVCITQVS